MTESIFKNQILAGNGRSTADRACSTIHEAIIEGILKPGERLVEAKIAKELGISITPIRQAFSVLANQGLLTVFPYKGTYVTILTKELIDDLKFARLNLENLAIGKAFPNIVAADAKQLRNFCKLSDFHFQNNELAQAIYYDLQLHEFFICKSQSPILLEMWTMLKPRIEYYQTLSKAGTQDENYMQWRHMEIVKAVENMDFQMLQTAMRSHLETSFQIINFPYTADIVYK
ncbi:MAG: GntR family transcriptional regulator [Candidatus Heteroscillospira sp.]|jgi:DNA-binding GntR family transcriptional regulator